jgi:hypothetical protein
MSVAEMKSEILKLSPDELNQLWEVMEDAIDLREAQESLKEIGESISAEDLKRKLGV